MLEKFISYFVKRHLLTNLVFFTVFISGIFVWQNIKKEEMPDVTFDRVRISVNYPGATAEEVEHFVTRPLEEEVVGLDGVYRVISSASQGSTTVTVEIEKDYPNKDEVIIEIRNAVSGADLPEAIRDDPDVRVFKTAKKAIIDIALYDQRVRLLDTDRRLRLQEFAHALENQLVHLPEINSVNKSNYLQEEIQIKVDPQKIIDYAIPLSQVINEARNSHVREPAGHIEAQNEPKVTLNAQMDTIEKLDGLIVQAGFEGQAVALRDIALVERAFDLPKEITKVNGREAIILNVVKNTSFGILESLTAVNRIAENFRKNYLQDTGIKIVTLDDESIDLRNRLSIIFHNGLIGFTLILICLFLFLNKRSGLWVAMGIPFTICFTLVAAYLMGFTINNITLAAVIIVMGMIVDDAIVVAENISRLRAQKNSMEKAVVEGTAQVFFPILGSILTTCIAFVPLYFFAGRFGQLNRFMPPIIFLMLGASLLESLMILPGHMHLEMPRKNRRFVTNRQQNDSGKVHWFEKIENRYGRLLEKILSCKNFIFLGFLILLIVCALVVKTTMKYVMFPREETREITISGKTYEKADRYETEKLTRKIEAVISPYLGREVIAWRTQIARSRRGGAVEENQFRMIVEIVPKEKRRQSADKLIALWKPAIEGIGGFEEIAIQKSRWGQSSGSAIEIIVQEDNDILRVQAVERLVGLMEKNPALMNIDVERPIKIPEYKIDLKREKVKRLAINPPDIASTLRASLEGVILYEIPKGDEEIDVRLTVIDENKGDIEKILDVPVENKSDYLVPVKDVVFVHAAETPNAISRRDLKRTTTVYADLNPKAGRTPLDVAVELEENDFMQVTKNQPTTALSFVGEVQDTREAGGDFKNAIILVLFLIFVTLALLFNSLTRPLVIMMAIPFGIVGIVLAFLLHGKLVFGFFASVGVLGLAGVVINDSIIMLTKLDRELLPLKARASDQQIASIAKTRLRAVVLTTLTTVAGIVPTAYGFAGYDAMLSEMMLALAWGLCFGTLITLVLVPCAYSAMQDIQFKVSSLFRESA